MKSLSWFATAVVLAFFVTHTAQAAPLPQARWTIMVYMSGDNNLEDYIVKDIEEELGLATARTQMHIRDPDRPVTIHCDRFRHGASSMPSELSTGSPWHLHQHLGQNQSPRV